MSSHERRLADIAARLPAAERETLLAFAEFLLARAGVLEPAPVPVPEPIPRPEMESVVAAIKRLSASYHMVDRSKMLHATSALMGEHVMRGRPADEIIDELELLFRRHYEKQFGSRD